MKTLDPLASLLRKAERLANPAAPRPPRDTPAIYKPPKRARFGTKCRDCGRLLGDYNGKQCVVCYRAAARRRYEAKVALRELKMRVAREAGL